MYSTFENIILRSNTQKEPVHISPSPAKGMRTCQGPCLEDATSVKERKERALVFSLVTDQNIFFEFSDNTIIACKESHQLSLFTIKIIDFHFEQEKNLKMEDLERSV